MKATIFNKGDNVPHFVLQPDRDTEIKIEFMEDNLLVLEADDGNVFAIPLTPARDISSPLASSNGESASPVVFHGGGSVEPSTFTFWATSLEGFLASYEAERLGFKRTESALFSDN